MPPRANSLKKKRGDALMDEVGAFADGAKQTRKEGAEEEELADFEEEDVPATGAQARQKRAGETQEEELDADEDEDETEDEESEPESSDEEEEVPEKKGGVKRKAKSLSKTTTKAPKSPAPAKKYVAHGKKYFRSAFDASKNPTNTLRAQLANHALEGACEVSVLLRVQPTGETPVVVEVWKADGDEKLPAKYLMSVFGGDDESLERRKNVSVWLLKHLSKAKEAGAEQATLRKLQREEEEEEAEYQRKKAERKALMESLKTSL